MKSLGWGRWGTRIEFEKQAYDHQPQGNESQGTHFCIPSMLLYSAKTHGAGPGKKKDAPAFSEKKASIYQERTTDDVKIHACDAVLA